MTNQKPVAPLRFATNEKHEGVRRKTYIERLSLGNINGEMVEMTEMNNHKNINQVEPFDEEVIYKSKKLMSFNINGRDIDIIASGHAVGRMIERDVNEYVVAGNVIALGPERIQQLQATRDEAIIIDEDKNVSVVVGFSQRRITIITVIDKANVFVKKGTEICKL